MNDDDRGSMMVIVYLGFAVGGGLVTALAIWALHATGVL